MANISRQALVGHIGGTFISLAIADIDELSIAHFALLTSADFDTPLDAIERYLKSVPRCPDNVSLAVAGTVTDGQVRMTYHPWAFDRDSVARVTQASRVVFVPDLEAVASALPHLTDYDVLTLAPGQRHRRAPLALVSVGTGLGVAGVVPAGGDWTVLPALGAGMSLPLCAREELGLRDAFAADGQPWAGDVLSGEGLMTLYRAAAKAAGGPATETAPPDVIRAGIAGDDRSAATALDFFTAWLGRFAGDVALTLGASGGLYLGGVIAPNLAPLLQQPGFRAAFEGGGARGEQLSRVPVFVIKTAADAGLRGAAIAMARSLSASP